MKAIIISLLAIILAIVLIFGNILWGKQQSSPSPIKKTENYKKNTVPTSSGTPFSLDYYLSITDAWPKNAKKQLEAKLQKNQNYHILLLGSEAIGDNKTGLLPIIKEKLASSYDRYVTIESIVYDGTSTEYVENDEVANLIQKKPDMIIFEPFTLNDNNVVGMDESLSNISNVISDTQQELPNATFVLQPPNQVYHANLFPLQVDALQTYSEKHHIPYLNHLESWPAGDNEDLLNYVTKSGVITEKGYEVWSDYITNFLVKE
ncbi:hypothetical protein [Niallia sp. 03133]|uniref:hypothetical protein n=1 Tax=Niallia sp. 03133 TaxID=3458060 RepID=UPI004043A507